MGANKLCEKCVGEAAEPGCTAKSKCMWYLTGIPGGTNNTPQCACKEIGF